jgi:hypothetical protein
VLGRTTIGGFLAYLNSPAQLGETNSEYFDFAMDLRNLARASNC